MVGEKGDKGMWCEVKDRIVPSQPVQTSFFFNYVGDV